MVGSRAAQKVVSIVLGMVLAEWEIWGMYETRLKRVEGRLASPGKYICHHLPKRTSSFRQ